MGTFCFILLVIIGFISFRRFAFKFDVSKTDISIAFAVKVLYSIGFILIFTYFYGDGLISGDAYNFFNDSKVLYQNATTNPVEYLKLLVGFSNDISLIENTNIWSYGNNGDFINDNRFIIRINSVIHFFSFQNIYVHAYIMSMLSFLGTLLLFKTFEKYVSNKRLFLFFLIMLPSIGFWTSGLSKESLMTFGVGLYLYALFKLLKKRSLKALLLFVTAIGVLLFNKPYAGLIIIPISVLLIIGDACNWNFKALYLSTFLIIATAFLTLYLPEPFNTLSKISYKQRDMVNIGKGGVFLVTDSSFCAFDYKYREHFNVLGEQEVQIMETTVGEYKIFGESLFLPFAMPASDEVYGLYLIQPPSSSYIETKLINYDQKNLVLSIPKVLFNSLFRPLPWDNGSSLKYFSLINNVIFLFVLISAFIYRRKDLPKKVVYIVFFCLLSGVFAYILIGLTTPILGALVRYKVIAEILFIILAFIMLRPIKILKDEKITSIRANSSNGKLLSR